MMEKVPFLVRDVPVVQDEDELGELEPEVRNKIEAFEQCLAEHGDELCPGCNHPLEAHGVIDRKYWGWIHQTETRDGKHYLRFLYRVPKVCCGVFVACSGLHDPNDPESYDTEQCNCHGHDLWPMKDRPKLGVESAYDRELLARGWMPVGG